MHGPPTTKPESPVTVIDPMSDESPQGPVLDSTPPAIQATNVLQPHSLFELGTYLQELPQFSRIYENVKEIRLQHHLAAGMVRPTAIAMATREARCYLAAIRAYIRCGDEREYRLSDSTSQHRLFGIPIGAERNRSFTDSRDDVYDAVCSD
jgi:hypothetical protein